MIGFASPMFGKSNVAGGVAGPIDPATLFTGGMAGGYYNFTDGASFAVNADGTGGVPAIGAACRSALDKSPNGNRLRNTTSEVPLRRAGGIESTGVGYGGLFNFATVGDWPNIPQPFEVIVCAEQIAFAGTDTRILSSGPSTPWFLLQGTASGKVRYYDGALGVEYDPGLGAEFVIDGYFSGAESLVSYNGAAMVSSPGQGQPLSGIVLGSDPNGGNSTQIRFKHLLAIGRALTNAERAGVVLWMQA